MNIAPNNQEEILEDYAESCRLRFIANPGEANSLLAINHPESWVRTCRESVINAIRDGRDTWERISDVAAKHKASRSQWQCPCFNRNIA